MSARHLLDAPADAGRERHGERLLQILCRTTEGERAAAAAPAAACPSWLAPAAAAALSSWRVPDRGAVVGQAERLCHRHRQADRQRTLTARRRASVPLDDAPELFAADDTQAAIVRRDVGKLLAQLPEAKRKLLTAVKLDGEAVADVARDAAMSEAAVKVSVHRSLKSLSEQVGGPDADR